MLDGDLHRPLGCHTVLVSVNARIRAGPLGGAVQSGSTAGSVDGAPPAGRSTRVSVGDAAASSAPHSTAVAPARSIARTASCEASHGATSAVEPVSTLTTPPGTSDVASTSLSVTAGSGRSCDASTTTAFPVTITGATTETSPSSDDFCGATTATTPVGSGSERLK